MKRPYYNLQHRLLIRLDTLQGACMELNIAWLRLCRDIKRSAKRSKFLLFIFSVVFSFLRGGKKKPKQTCKNCRFNCEDDHTCMNDCNVGSYYAEKGLNRICYEGELWEGK